MAGYEIHHGHSSQHAGMPPGRAVWDGGLGWQNEAGNVMGTLLHGLFENPQVLQALFGAQVSTLDRVFDRLADFVARHFTPGVRDELIR